jgi:hypothetical protein
MTEYLGRGLLTIWCVAHRSDLALESIDRIVPEFRHWKTDLKALATYYRASSRRQEDMEILAMESGITAKRFPKHHEVRFAEHHLNLVSAVVHNLSSMRKHWEKLIDDDMGDRGEKEQAKGFLKIWGEASVASQLSYIMMDILRLFQDLQKESQRTMVTLPDLLLVRDRVIKSLELMEERPYPGGQEEIAVANRREGDGDEDMEVEVELERSRIRRTTHSLVTNRDRSCASRNHSLCEKLSVTEIEYGTR